MGRKYYNPNPQKNNSNLCENYRAICLSSVPMKVYTRIIEQKLRNKIEKQLQEEQAAFRNGRQTQDHISTIRRTMEKLLDREKDLYMAFIDLKTAFDSVQKQYLWRALKEYDLDQKLIQIIKSNYRKVEAYVRIQGEESEMFYMKTGIKQGDSLSPLLFVMFMDRIIKNCKRQCHKVKVGNWNMEPIHISNLAFADDLIVMAETPEKLQRNLNIWNQELKDNGMEINKQKTKVMKISKSEIEPGQQIKIENEILEWVGHYDYLGTRITKNGKINAEIIHRQSKASQVYYQLNNTIIIRKNLPTRLKCKFTTLYMYQRSQYGLESTVLNEKHLNQLQASEMKFLRRTVGKTKRDKIRNTKIREDTEQIPIQKIIENKQLRWYGHVNRMENIRIPKRVSECKAEGKRNRGRPRTTYEEQMGQIARKRGKTLAEIKKMSKERQIFRRWIEAPTP